MKFFAHKFQWFKIYKTYIICSLSRLWHRGRDSLDDLGVDRMILKLVLKVMSDDVDWIHLAYHMVQWRDLLNTIMNLLDSENGGEFLDWLRDCYLIKKDSASWMYIISRFSRPCAHHLHAGKGFSLRVFPAVPCGLAAFHGTASDSLADRYSYGHSQMHIWSCAGKWSIEKKIQL
jgi:hypothetical protein